ncbi:hypothetical protein BH10ACI1_BH10ACI1_09800 [soil metagenome]
MALSTTETVGFLDQINQLMRSSKDALLGGGLDVTGWIADTETLKNNCLVLDSEKDALKAASKAKTGESDTANKSAYKSGSTRLDAIIGVLGKDTTAGKQARRLRSSLLPKPRNTQNNPPNN